MTRQFLSKSCLNDDHTRVISQRTSFQPKDQNTLCVRISQETIEMHIEYVVIVVCSVHAEVSRGVVVLEFGSTQDGTCAAGFSEAWQGGASPPTYYVSRNVTYM